MGSAHHLTKRNIWAKLNENSLKATGDMEQTGNSSVNLRTLKCDLDLESG